MVDLLLAVYNVTAYIQFPDNNIIANITLYDDGLHSDDDPDVTLGFISYIRSITPNEISTHYAICI